MQLGNDRLDVRSREVLRAFIRWFAFCGALTLVAAVHNAWTLSQIRTTIEALFLFCALLRVVVAILEQENPRAPSLTHWDEAIAFNGLALLVHAMKRLTA